MEQQIKISWNATDQDGNVKPSHADELKKACIARITHMMNEGITQGNLSNLSSWMMTMV